MILAIRNERIRRNWTQEYVARKIGLTKTAVCDIERGKQKPSYEVLVRLEDLFGLPHRELFAEVADDEDAAEKGNKENSL